MSTATMVGLVLIAVGILDVVIGFLVVVPRVREEARPVLRVALAAGAAVSVVLGGLFLAGVIPLST